MIDTGNHAVAPGPGGWLEAFPNLANLQAEPVRYFRDQQERHGDVVRIRLGPFLTHLVTHPDHVRHVLAKNNRNYCRGRFYDKFKLFFRKGILTSDGTRWKQNRSVIQPAFRESRIENLVKTIAQASESLTAKWKEQELGKRGCDIFPETMSLAMEILGRTMFDTGFGAMSEELTPAIDASLRTMFLTGAAEEMVPLWIPTKFNRAVRNSQNTLRTLMRNVLHEHRLGGKDPSNLVSLMLTSAKHGNRAMTDRQIIDEMITVFIAGHETSGTALAWTLYNLARHPEIQAKLNEEVDAVLAGQHPVLNDLKRLRYTQMVVNESLRLYPPIWLFPRDALADDEVGGYRIPKGSTVFVSPLITHRLPEFWDNPDDFEPERFKEVNGSVGSLESKFAYIPFGGGQRVCIGRHMANLSLVVSVASLCQRFRFETVGEIQPGFTTSVSLRPKGGIPLRFYEREAISRPHPCSVQFAGSSRP